MKYFKKAPDIMLAEIQSPEELIHAAEKICEAGYEKYDCHSPFPIHGMDQAMKLKRSPIGYIVGTMGAIGLLGSLFLQWWTSSVDYPLVISGKPLFSFQAFVPVTFALTVLLSAFGALFGMLGFNKLPQLYHPIFNSEQFKKFSDNGFFISINADDPKYDAEATAKFLESIGGTNVEVVKDED